MSKVRSIAALIILSLSLSAFSAEFAIMNEVITLSSSNNGFYFVYNTNKGPVNWVSPDNFRDGQVYFRYEMINQPANALCYLSFDIWGDYNSVAKTYTESAAPISGPLTTTGTVSTSNSSPATWYANQTNGPVNFNDRTTFWRWGIVHWFSKNPNYVLAPVGWSPNPQSWAAWATNNLWLPLQARVTIVAVSQGSTFSGWENYINPPANPPLAPSLLNAGNITTQSAQLSWTDNSNNEQGFKIEYRADANANYTEIGTVGADIVTYSHSGLNAATLYHYRVRAYNATGNSAYSNIADVTTLNVLPPSVGPIAHYTFENSVADISGNGHNGTLVNGAGFSVVSFKEGLSSLMLDGTNDYVDIGTINLGNSFTFASWVYIPNGANNIQTLIGNTTSGSASNGFKITVNTYGTSDRKIILETGNGTQSGYTVSPASAFIFDNWNHIAVTVDKVTGQARIYFNGTDVTQSSALAANFETNRATRLGIMTNSIYAMRSNLDDTRLYDRVLSSTEINALVSNQPVLAPDPPNGLTAVVNGNAINLSWIDNSSNEDGFRLERSLTSATGFNLIHTSAANAIAYSDITAVAGTTYFYRVKAFNSGGESTNSNESSATIPVVPSGDLAAHYTFENSVADVTGNGHNGTLVNGATYSTQFKEGTQSLLLDGVNDYVDIGTFNLGNRFTFASWVYIPSGSSNIRTLFANTSSGGTSNGFKICVNTYSTTDRKIILETGNGTQFAQTASLASTFGLDAWNHVAITVDQVSGQSLIYYNGVDVTSNSALAPNFSTNRATRLGIMTNSNFAMRSNLDDTRIYTKVLSASEIAALVGTGPVTTPNPPSGLTASGITNAINLSWNDNSSNENGFKIERSLTSGSGFNLIHTTLSNITTYNDQTAIPGVTYFYRINAFIGSGNSTYSNTASGIAQISLPGNLASIIMPLGNSLTYDDFSGDSRPEGLRTGYRQPLWLTLEEYGYTLDFTGSRSAGYNASPSFDPDNEGHPGYTAAMIADSVYHWLSLNPAGIVLLEIGTNGLQSSTADVERILDEIDLFEVQNNIDITVILAQIPNRNVYSSLTTTFNNNLETMANARIASGDLIVVVDMENGAGLNYQLQPAGDFRDNLHPNQNGYNKMAVLWFNAILTVLPAQSPALPNAPVNLNGIAITDAISLNWDDMSFIETGYRVERMDLPAGTFNIIATLPANTESYSDMTVVANDMYSYRVQAFNTTGNSGYSNTVNVTAGNPLPEAGLIAHYTFENSVLDISGNGHNGNLFNGATYSSSVVKEGSNSLLLDGINDYVDIGTIDLGNKFTYASWVYLPTGTTNIRTLIASANSGAVSAGFKIMINTYNTADRRIIVETGNGTQTGHTVSPLSTFGLNAWNHIAVVADLTTGQSGIYYNGVDVTETSGILTNFPTNRATRLGIMSNSNFPMRSNLDDTRLYNRVLSPAEISNLVSMPGLKSTKSDNTNQSGLSTDIPQVFPNPFTDYLVIRSTVKMQTVEIYTVLGVKIYDWSGINAYELTINDLNKDNSLYFIKVLLENQQSHTIKVIRNGQ